MKYFFKAAIALISGVIAASVLSVAACAETYKKWNGTTELEPGKQYSLSADYTCEGDLTIPQDVILYVRRGLVVNGTLIVKGTLKIAEGGEIKATDGVKTNSASELYCSGTLVSKQQLSAGGKFYIGKTGSVTAYGDITFKKSSALTVNGKLLLAKESTAALNGNVLVKADGTLTINGEAALASGKTITDKGLIKLAGTLGIGGAKLKVADSGIVKGDGSITLKKYSEIENAGKVTAAITPPKPVTTDGFTYVGGILVANKQYSLPSDYAPGVINSAWKAYLKLKDGAKAAGYTTTIISSFRSYEKQKEVFAYWCRVYGTKYAKRISAEPGTSEHQTGLAFDLTSLETSYGDTAQGKWLAASCAEYGFIIRYPKGKESVTGYSYEPWHIRYLGVSTARLVKQSGLCLEEFLGISED